MTERGDLRKPGRGAFSDEGVLKTRPECVLCTWRRGPGTATKARGRDWGHGGQWAMRRGCQSCASCSQRFSPTQPGSGGAAPSHLPQVRSRRK